MSKICIDKWTTSTVIKEVCSKAFLSTIYHLLLFKNTSSATATDPSKSDLDACICSLFSTAASGWSSQQPRRATPGSVTHLVPAQEGEQGAPLLLLAAAAADDGRPLVAQDADEARCLARRVQQPPGPQRPHERAHRPVHPVLILDMANGVIRRPHKCTKNVNVSLGFFPLGCTLAGVSIAQKQYNMKIPPELGHKTI